MASIFVVQFKDSTTGVKVLLRCPLDQAAIELKQSLAKRLQIPWQLLTMRFNGMLCVLYFKANNSSPYIEISIPNCLSKIALVHPIAEIMTNAISCL